MFRLLLPALLPLLPLLPPPAPSSSPPDDRHSPLLWGELEPGPYPVGFQSFWDFDSSRTYDHVFADGSHYASGKASRPILVNLWYPAAPEERDSPPMCHGDYLALDSDPGHASLERLARALEDYERDAALQWAVKAGPGSSSEVARAQLEELLTAKVPCVRDAEAAAGPFPLVLYHAGYGSSFEDNSVLCESLASHGYVVAGSAYLDETGETFNIDGKEGSARDLAFLIQRLAREKNVDWTRIGLFGHSGGAHASLTYQSAPNHAVDAVVSLDTTQDTTSALDPHWSHPRKMLANVWHETTPLLVVAPPQAFFQTCDALTHAERRYLTFRDLDHDEYTSQGIVAAEFVARRARAESSQDADALTARAHTVRRNYESCCTYLRAFFDAKLRDDPTLLAELTARYEETPLGGAEPHVEVAPVGASGPVPYDEQSTLPPTPRQFVQLLEEERTDLALHSLERFRETHPEAPIYDGSFAYGVLYDRVVRGHEDVAARLAPFFGPRHPELVRRYLWWVDRDGERNTEEYRRPALHAARLLAPDDEEVARRIRDLPPLRGFDSDGG